MFVTLHLWRAYSALAKLPTSGDTMPTETQDELSSFIQELTPGPVNLDALTREENLLFWGLLATPAGTKTFWENSFADEPYDNRTVSLLRQYVATRDEAMRLRLDGEVRSALNLEDTCETIYGWLPSFTRW